MKSIKRFEAPQIVSDYFQLIDGLESGFHEVSDLPYEKWQIEQAILITLPRTEDVKAKRTLLKGYFALIIFQSLSQTGIPKGDDEFHLKGEVVIKLRNELKRLETEAKILPAWILNNRFVNKILAPYRKCFE